MTEEQPERLPNGGRKYENEIANVTVSIEGQELTFKKAAKQLRVIADMVEAGMMDADGFNWLYGGEYSLSVNTPPSFPHGDYTDMEGNLVHIGADDHVINVTWAKKGAKQEDLADQDIHVFEWIKEHGPLTPAGSGEAEGHEHHHG
jgi:hypothetical protein